MQSPVEGRACANGSFILALLVMPDVSVILPTCDRPDLIPRALGSILAQAGTDFEVVMGATVLPNLDDVDPESFLPSSRSIASLRC